MGIVFRCLEVLISLKYIFSESTLCTLSLNSMIFLFFF